MNLARLSLSSRSLLAPTTRRFYSTPAFNINEHKQFIIFAYDGKDPKALERRLAARPAHLVRAKEAKKNGTLLYGGAMLDKEGKMIGSVMLMNNLTESQIKKFLDEDPYVTEKAWESYEIKPFRLANLDE